MVKLFVFQKEKQLVNLCHMAGYKQWLNIIKRFQFPWPALPRVFSASLSF
jgi:hypothetical protein